MRLALLRLVLCLGTLLAAFALRASAPYSATQSATQITPNSAVLNGMVAPNGLPTMAWFEWGTNGVYNQTTSADTIPAGTALGRVVRGISGLTTRDDLGYRLVASNAMGVAYGARQALFTGRSVAVWGDGSYAQLNLPSSLNKVVGFSAGGYHSLALSSGGSVVAWGAGKVDFESYPNYRQSRVPAALANAVAVAAGGFHSLALQANGVVLAWGGNWVGQTNVPNFSSFVVSVAAGDTHSVALMMDGKVSAWGDNYRGQTNVPAGLSNVVAIAAGADHTLALKTDGTLVAWGTGPTPPAGLTNVVAITSGTKDMAMKSDGTVVIWGTNGSVETNAPPGLDNAEAFSSGGGHFLASIGGAAVAWGDNTYGQTNVPAGLSNVLAVAAGGRHSLAAYPNLKPQAIPQSVSGSANQDLPILLSGSDPTGDALTFRVASLPAKGSLFQSVGGSRGPAITTANTPVTDPGGQILFAPLPDEYGAPYTSFGFLANDGEADSPPAAITINVSIKPCQAFTQPPGRIQPTSATLCGTALPNGLQTVAWFEWGTNGSYGQVTSPVAVGAGTVFAQASTDIGGLATGGVYQYRVVVSNRVGIARGAANYFTTGRKVFTWGNNQFSQTNLPHGLSNTVAIAAGSIHGLALKADGTLRSWGDNSRSQTNIPAGLNGVTAISAGSWHSLALKTDGTVEAWGAGTFDSGISPHYGQSIEPWDLSNVVAVAAGGTHSLALRSDGIIVAWGNTNSSRTAVPSGLTNVVAIAGGGSHSLALKIDGTVAAWGNNSGGQTNVPFGLTNVISIAARGDVSLAQTADGRVVAWGDNTYGQTNLPADLGVVRGMTTSGNRCAVVRADGTMLAWGDNSYDQTNVPLSVAGVLAAVQGSGHTILLGPNLGPEASAQSVLAAANFDSVIRFSGTDPNQDALAFQIVSVPSVGQLYQYSGGLRGALLSAGMFVNDPLGRVIFAPATNATGSAYASFAFRATDGEASSAPSTVTFDIAPSAAFTQPAILVTTNSATLAGFAAPNGYAGAAWFEWGPDGTFGQVSAPVAHGGNGIAWVTNPVTGLLSSRIYQCRLVVSNTTGLVYGPIQRFVTGRRPNAWGLSSSGQITVPSNLTNAVAVAGGNKHSLALKTDGKVIAWGDNTSGQVTVPATLSNVVAISTRANHNLALRSDGRVTSWGATVGPVTVPAWLSNVTAVAAGGIFSAALRSDGTPVVWGSSSYGVTNVPTDLANVVAIAAGYQHCLALTSVGKVIAWGYPDQRVAVPPDLRNVVAIAAGEMHSLALKSDGTVIAWGTNNFGQINVPPTLSNVVAIAAGYDHSLALRINGALVAWGNNASGQTNTQAGVTNFAAITAGGDHSLAIANRPPNAFGQSVYANANRDRLTTLSGSDADGDVFTCRITALPTAGALYQYATNGRGSAIQAPNTLVTDPNKRVYFAPPLDNFTDRPQFKFRMNDGLADSSEASVGITIYPPPAPDITSIGPGAGNTLRITFTGDANTSHCVWISTNLATWQYFGQATQTGPGDFLFVDFFATNCPRRYYRVQAACLPPALEITGFSRQPGGNFEVVFGAAPGGTYQVLASTNLLNWEALGPAQENPPGIFRFLDTSAAQRPNRFYRLSKP